MRDFLRLEASAGVILMIAALMALVAANSVLSQFYTDFLAIPVAIQFGGLEIAKPLVLWINDGLMAIFFFLVGLEIKREIMRGELSSFDKAALPLFAAVGGMVGPALIYVAFNHADPETIRGWAIPAATDIAFALGILALLGTRAPVSLKVLLLAIAIIDDLGAIVIIALFYTADLSIGALAYAAIGVLGLVALNRSGVKRIAPYALIGTFIWVCVLKSGVHATLAGVLTALLIPLDGKTKESHSPLETAEHALHPWVAFAILPIFAFANAGVSFEGISIDALFGIVPLGIALGLFFGKQFGVMLAAFIAVKLKVAKLPANASWLQVYGIACITGVGFTMSLFIGTLAFQDASVMNEVRLGVLMGSIASGITGFCVLYMAGKETASNKSVKTPTSTSSTDELPSPA